MVAISKVSVEPKLLGAGKKEGNKKVSHHFGAFQIGSESNLELKLDGLATERVDVCGMCIALK